MGRKQLIDAGTAMKDIKKLLLETHAIKQKKNSCDYKGIDITDSRILAHSFSIKKSMQADSVKWQKEEHGIEMIDTIIEKIFQLGFEQGMVYSELQK